MTSSAPDKSPSISPRWIIFAFLIAVLSALLIGALWAWLPAATPARATGDDMVLRDADADLTRGEDAHALALLTPLATHGDGRAQAMLARLAMPSWRTLAHGVPDRVKAQAWFAKGVAQLP